MPVTKSGRFMKICWNQTAVTWRLVSGHEFTRAV